MAVEKFASVIIVTLVYVLLYYLFLLNVLRAKVLVLRQCKERGEKFNRYENDYPELRAADRIQLNMLEHMPTFLVALWLHAVFVSVVSATWLGGLCFHQSDLPIILGHESDKKYSHAPPHQYILGLFYPFGHGFLDGVGCIEPFVLVNGFSKGNHDFFNQGLDSIPDANSECSPPNRCWVCLVPGRLLVVN